MGAAPTFADWCVFQGVYTECQCRGAENEAISRKQRNVRGLYVTAIETDGKERLVMLSASRMRIIYTIIWPGPNPSIYGSFFEAFTLDVPKADMATSNATFLGGLLWASRCYERVGVSSSPYWNGRQHCPSPLHFMSNLSANLWRHSIYPSWPGLSLLSSFALGLLTSPRVCYPLRGRISWKSWVESKRYLFTSPNTYPFYVRAAPAPLNLNGQTETGMKKCLPRCAYYRLYWGSSSCWAIKLSNQNIFTIYRKRWMKPTLLT